MPNRSPLYSISNDIAWTIFLSIASDLDMHASERLSEVIKLSHVYTTWRELILNAPSIWSKLLWVNNSDCSRYWLPVVLERSRSSALWIEGDVYTGGREKYADSATAFFKLLDDEWDRVERLVVGIYGNGQAKYYGSRKQIHSILCRPAPALRTFVLDDRTSAIDMHNPPSSVASCCPLFGGSAPRLSQFGTNMAPLTNLTCLCNIRNFYTARRSLYSTNVRQFLTVLEDMRCLESLAVYHDIIDEATPLTTAPLPTVSLPFLSKLVLHTTAKNCLAILNNVKPSQTGCLVSCNASIDPWDPVVESTLNDLRTAFARIMAEHIRLAHDCKSIKSIELHIMDGVVLLNDACSILSGHDSNKFKLSLSWPSWVTAPEAPYPPGFLKSVCELFKLAQLSAATRLRLALFDDHGGCFDFAVFRPLLASFESAKSIEMDLMAFKLLSSISVNAATNSPPVFPALTVLRLTERHDHQRPTLCSKFMDGLIRFLSGRVTPLKVLDFACDLVEEEVTSLVRALEELKLEAPLRVCWWQEGKPAFRVLNRF
ncbi:hypothetical protein CPC08DRAFT_766931 [Agrocybe pediades]|nr:hypothetical protein CPC08DRAFT_766931 [Agrocybe pediades]